MKETKSSAAHASPETVFEKLGLRPRGLLRAAAPDAANSDLSGPARFRGALEELGGLYALFGQFLAWRADLLRTDYLGRLRHIRVPVEPLTRAECASILAADLGTEGESLLATFDAEPCWNTMSRCAFRAVYKGRPIVVQFARDPISEAEFEAFENGVRLITEPRVAEALRPGVLAEFRDWVRLAELADRERGYLEALNAHREWNLAQYPELIPELSASRVLATDWIEGESVSVRIAQGSADAVLRLAECVLEQICATGAIDGDFDPESMVITSSGRLGVRRVNRLVAIPAPQASSCLKYISAVLASNAPVAAQNLARLAAGRPALILETRLLDELSNLEPELKVNLQFPASAAIFEGNWRALRRSGALNPLYVDMLHRNLLAVGYWNAETTGAGASKDALAEAQWPVLGRVLRTRFADMLNRETASEWLAGSGLLFFEFMRQANRLAEGLRENDMSLGVDLEHGTDIGRAHRRIRMGIYIGMVLVLFLASVRFALSAPAPWTGVFSAVAAVAAFALFWFLSRFD